MGGVLELDCTLLKYLLIEFVKSYLSEKYREFLFRKSLNILIYFKSELMISQPLENGKNIN